MSGTASLGGTLAIVDGGGSLAANQNYRILNSAQSGLSGTFAQVTGGPPLRFATNYDNDGTLPDGVFLTVRLPTTTTLQCSGPRAGDVSIGNVATCRAFVSGSAGTGTPTGTVSLSSDGPGTFSNAGSCTLNSSGFCDVDYAPSDVGSGTHRITATYGGSTVHADSSGHQDLTVTKRFAGTSVSCGTAPVTVGQTTTCTATVSDTDTGTSTGTPTGTVGFSSNGPGTFSSSGSCTLSAGSCQVTYAPSAPGTTGCGGCGGPHTITASYGGDSTHQGPTPGHASVTTERTTGATLSCAPASATIGKGRTCTATVSDTDTGTHITPGGTVNLQQLVFGNALLSGSCTLSSGSCQLAYNPYAGAGTATLRADYVATDSKHKPSSSLQIDVTFTRRASGTSVACAPASVSLDSATTCTATVTDVDTGVPNPPSGTVSFSVPGSGKFSNPAACTLPSSSSLHSPTSESCHVTYTPTAVTGVRTLTANYGGDGAIAGSSGTAPLTVKPAAFKGATLTLATVAASPGGTVTLSVHNPNPISAQGSLTLTTTTGTHGFATPAKTVRLASAKFRVRARATVRVKVRLSRAARSLVKRKGKLRAKATVVLKARGKSITSRRTIRIVARRR